MCILQENFFYIPPAKDVRNVLIFACSFNPPTKAHSMIMNIAAKLPQCDSIVLVLSTHHINKDLTQVPYNQRLVLAKEMTSSNNKASLLISNSGRFIKIAQYIENICPQVNSSFIMGMDNLYEFLDYENNSSDELNVFFQKHFIYVVNRFGRQMDIGTQWKDKIIILPDEVPNISSTQARELISNDKNCSHCVENSIYENIKKNNLYTICE
jgi:nicotinic acid mononucleotide adenylyltransferase